MDKDRVEGAGKQAAGKTQEAAGKIIGDKKMQAEGVAKKTEGGVQNAAGSVKDALRDQQNKQDKRPQ